MLNKNVPNNKTYDQGNYANEIKNPNKYIGNLSKIYFRSSQEYKFCIYCDNEPDIIKQGVECVEIPYKIPNEKIFENGRKSIVIEDKRYYPDFYIEKKKGNSFERMLLEIKPHKQTLPPPQPKSINNKKQMMRYNIEYENQRKNMIKQKHAKEYCIKMGISFKLLTEENFKFK